VGDENYTDGYEALFAGYAIRTCLIDEIGLDGSWDDDFFLK